MDNNSNKQNQQNQFAFWTLAGVLIFILLIVTTLGGMVLAFNSQNTVAHGIYLEGQSIAGLTRNEANAMIMRTANQKIQSSSINLIYNDNFWKITPDMIGLTIDTDSAMEEVYAPGHTGSFAQRLIENLHYAVYGKDIKFNVSYDQTALANQLSIVADSINHQPVSAACFLGNDGSIQRSNAITGLQLPTEDLQQYLNEKILALNVPKAIPLEPVVTDPAVTDADLQNIDSILASYSTHFNEGDSNRSQNIRVAAAAIDGILIKPNQEFSFNNTVGYRTPANGYRSAPVIVDGKIEEDFGGGVCQVSSTLYNAILYAGLTSTERTRHYYPSSYVPAGQDATVADYVLDFKFRNPHPHGVYLLTKCYYGTVTVYVAGCGADMQGRNFQLENVPIKGGAAPVVTLYRVTYQNGTEVARENLHTDHYDEQVSTEN